MNIGALRNWNTNTNRLPLTGIGLTISILNPGYSYIDQANCRDAGGVGEGDGNGCPIMIIMDTQDAKCVTRLVH